MTTEPRSLDEDLADLRAMLTTVLGAIDNRPRRALKIPEVAEQLGVTRAKVDAMIANGDLPFVILPTMKERRVPVAAVDALVAPERWLIAEAS